MSLTEIAKVSLSAPDHFFIGGEWVKPSSSDQIDVVNSSTEEVFLRVAEAKAEDMDRAIAAARAAFDRGPWPRLTHAERADYMLKVAAAIEERGAKLVYLVRTGWDLAFDGPSEWARLRRTLPVLRQLGR